MNAGPPPLGWPAIARLGLVQAALGAVVVLTTSTLNRIMVVELALPALLPGLLVALHHAVQLARPRLGHGSDVGGRRTPWIVGGMAVLGAGGVLAAWATTWMASDFALGCTLAALGFVLIGLGVSATGTSLLVLLAKRVAPERRAAAATLVWLMMIVGFAVTAGVAGHWLDPYTPQRLLAVSAVVAALALAVTLVAVRGIEGAAVPAIQAMAAVAATPSAPAARADFRSALRTVWADAAARRFTAFVFLSMLAYSAQDLILEPFAGLVMGYTPGQSTQLSGLQHGGVLLGMLLAALAGRPGRRWGSLRQWMVGGCLASGLAMAALVGAALVGPGWPFRATVFALGAANGAFSIAAIASMMQLAGASGRGDEGVRMGLWGAAQAIAFALGGLTGTAASDLARALFDRPALAYGSVFLLEALAFWAAAGLAARPGAQRSRPASNAVATATTARQRRPAPSTATGGATP